MAERPRIDALFDFSTIAVIGASPRNVLAFSALKGFRSIGFAGRAVCVNPNAEAVLDFPAYRTLEDVPFDVQHVICAIRADRIPAELEKCARLGVSAVTIPSAGFAEAGDEGRALQDEIRSIALRAGIAVCGPNCMGLLSVHDHTAAYCKGELPHVPGGVGVISHSGGVLNEILNYGTYRGLRFSKAVSAGNEAVCNVADFLEHLVDDPATTTIGLVLEGIRSPERLRAALALALERNKPVVAIKVGTSNLAAAAATMHTGANVGSAELFAALCAQYGVTLVRDIDQMCEALLVFSNAHTMLRAHREPRGVAVIEISGGGGELVCDIAERASLELRPLHEKTADALAEVLSTPSNPVDLGGSWEHPESVPRHEATLAALAADGGFDVVISRLTVAPDGDIPMILSHGQLMAAAARAHPEMLFAGLSRVPDTINPHWRAFVAEHGLVFAQGYERGLGAVAQLMEYRRCQAQPSGRPPAVARPTLAQPGSVLEGDAALAVLAQLGFPVQRADGVHAGLETVAGAYRDEVYGPVVVCGLGGPFAGIFGDHVLRLAPVDAAAAQRAIDRTKTGQLARGYRDLPAMDTRGLAEIVARLSAWIAGDERVADVDFDPVILSPQGATIVSARIVLAA